MKKYFLFIIFVFLFSCVTTQKKNIIPEPTKEESKYHDLVPPVESWCLPNESDPHRVHLNFKSREDFLEYQGEFNFEFNAEDNKTAIIEVHWFLRATSGNQEFIPFCIFKDVYHQNAWLARRHSNWVKIKAEERPKYFNCKDKHEGERWFLDFLLNGSIYNN
jgi:hypothetical protein